MSEEEKTEGSKEEIGIPKDMRVNRRPYTMTPAAIEARQMNAQKSTGPITEGGKASSSRNSWKHGLYSSSFITGFLGRPCKSTCDKFKDCSLVSDGTTAPGDSCLDKQFVAEAFDCIITAVQDGEMGGFQGMAALEMAGGVDILRMMKESIIENGVLVKDKKIDKDGKTIGEGFKLNPVLPEYNKMLVNFGFTPGDFNLTPAAIEKVNKNKSDDENTKTLADTLSDIGSSLKKSREKSAK
ncbi:MAG: hypothetical protein JRE23_00010 [Deltaproteobacteria bacterium]|nr:hypothetical protein [Deltaproteobacteria bacterium]